MTDSAIAYRIIGQPESSVTDLNEILVQELAAAACDGDWAIVDAIRAAPTLEEEPGPALTDTALCDALLKLVNAKFGQQVAAETKDRVLKLAGESSGLPREQLVQLKRQVDPVAVSAIARVRSGISNLLCTALLERARLFVSDHDPVQAERLVSRVIKFQVRGYDRCRRASQIHIIMCVQQPNNLVARYLRGQIKRDLRQITGAVFDCTKIVDAILTEDVPLKALDRRRASMVTGNAPATDGMVYHTGGGPIADDWTGAEESAGAREPDSSPPSPGHCSVTHGAKQEKTAKKAKRKEKRKGQHKKSKAVNKSTSTAADVGVGQAADGSDDTEILAPPQADAGNTASLLNDPVSSDAKPSAASIEANAAPQPVSQTGLPASPSPRGDRPDVDTPVGVEEGAHGLADTEPDIVRLAREVVASSARVRLLRDALVLRSGLYGSMVRSGDAHDDFVAAEVLQRKLAESGQRMAYKD